MKTFLLLLLVIVTSCSKFDHAKVLTVKPEKLERFNDQREFAFYTLKNKMKIYLISGEEIQKSLVSLSINSGSGLDPKGKEGMAHFLEHMLFLGTKKYPKTGEFQTFFNNNQGGFNAYTATERTNYHFEIPHNHLNEALDRFSEFFKAPLFTEKYVKREKYAVHSEHQKNLLNDMRRLYRIKQLMLPKDHPVKLFSTGNIDTLKNVTRDDVIDFYKKYYSANQMNLVIVSNKKISELKKMTKNFFGGIKNKDLPDPKFPWVESDKKAQLVSVRSMSQIQKLSLDFHLPALREKFWKSKPLFMLSHLIGHEGKNSLLSLLKKENLAFSLSAGFNESSYSNSFSINLNLTEKGLKNIDRIIGYTFDYIRKLKNNELKEYMHKELDTMSRLSYVYSEKSVDLHQAISIADLLFEYPYEDMEKRSTLFYENPTKGYMYALEAFKPENLTVFLMHPKAESNKKEKFYGIEYAINTVDEKRIYKWMGYTSSDLNLPVMNAYIPQNMAIKLDEGSKKPKLILDNEKGKFYFKQNDKLLYPNAITTLRILTDKKFINPKDEIIEKIFLMGLQESLNEWNYMLVLAGLDVSYSSFPRGIEISISGFADKIPLLLADSLKKIKELELTQERFNSYIVELNKSFENFKLQPEYKQASFWSSYVLKKDSFSNEQMKKALSQVKLKDVYEYSNRVFKKIKIEGLAYGNLSSEDLLPTINSVHETLGASVLEEENLIVQEEYKFEPKTYDFTFSTKGNNNVWLGFFQLGPRDLQMNSYMRILSSIVDSEFYSEMRTNQQLGYIVYSNYHYGSKSYGYSFLVQSSRYKPRELKQKALTWLQNIDSITNIDAKKFKQIKKTLFEDISRPEQTMKEKMVWLITQAFVLNGDFEYKDKFAQTIKKSDQKSFNEMVKTYFKENPIILNILLGKDLENSTQIPKVHAGLKTYK
jgi:insulysin